MNRNRLIEEINLAFDFLCAIIKTDKRYRLPCHFDDNKGAINILGTGPSLTESIKHVLLTNNTVPCLAVNEFALSDYFQILKPKYYILVDPAYFANEDSISERDLTNRKSLYNRINTLTDWNMTVIIPSKRYKQKVLHNIIHNPKVHISFFNTSHLTLANSRMYYWMLNHNIAFTCYNILAAAIYISINLGYKEIRIFGAEHSWTKDIRVNELNQVCTRYHHFYNDEDKLVPWMTADNKPFTMSSILDAMFRTFKAYNLLSEYANMHSCRIINCTPESFIDAFERDLV